MSTVPLRSGLGEMMGPNICMTALLLSPDGGASIEPGALHGRSRVESAVRFTSQRDELGETAELHWLIWLAIELDGEQPVRYIGASASELWIDPERKIGWKVLAGQVNGMSSALRGEVNLKGVGAREKGMAARQLIALSGDAWDASPELKGALA
jgi:hypothetical protein